MTTTNPTFQHLIKKQKRELQELRNIIEHKEAADEEAEAEESLDGPDVRAEMEVLKLRLQTLEESRQSSQIEISTLTERIDDLNSQTSTMRQHVHEDMEKMKESMRDTFVDFDIFNGIRQEIETLRTATETNIQAAVEERESTNEQIQQVQKLIADLKSGALAPSARETEVVGAGGAGGGYLASGNEEIRNMKILINGIDLSHQRQMRKMKRSIRKLERAVDDAAEDEARRQKLLELERNMQATVTQTHEEPALIQVPAPTADEQQQPGAPVTDETVTIEKRGETIQPGLSQFRLPIFPSGLGLLRDDFQLFFVLMFTLLLYFLVADLFS
jgi:prefoldin subunit 5